MQARIWYHQGKPEDAISKALRAIETFEKLGATKDLGRCKVLLQEIELEMAGELPKTIPLSMTLPPPS
jgi:hypothetical protein